MSSFRAILDKLNEAMLELNRYAQANSINELKAELKEAKVEPVAELAEPEPVVVEPIIEQVPEPVKVEPIIEQVVVEPEPVKVEPIIEQVPEPVKIEPIIDPAVAASFGTVKFDQKMADPTDVDEFKKLKDLLNSEAWPEAVDPHLICNHEDENDKIERAENIIEKFLKRFNNKKFLDFGCGEGHVVASMSSITDNAFGYDIVKSGNLEWETKNKYLLTTDLSKLEQYKPFDVIFLYDVIDHVDDQDKLLKNIHSLCNENTLVLVRCHPWCAAHGSHHYKQLNKAYIQLVFNDDELSKLGLTLDKRMKKTLLPLGTYRNLFEKNGFKWSDEDLDKSTVPSFFSKNNLIKNRILERYKSLKFPDFQMSQSFVDYKLQINIEQ